MKKMNQEDQPLMVEIKKQDVREQAIGLSIILVIVILAFVAGFYSGSPSAEYQQNLTVEQMEHKLTRMTLKACLEERR
ncbi:hypothetical protein AUK40_00720 [Candidatus Wirthbacteria bacterium CG2_30_54_11]|uniref:Uncharacterized protein n=1 Tax=Candidatus Wirthbacteria bacterium CG2_30_54_11 TaxID=1817892 RepID=A0A1J5IYH7_9BACT|nr:MAG: hypothetical protein AUK40_00720 [Candidatus Wirthbacteria bacterium CG2_30_54_11]